MSGRTDHHRFAISDAQANDISRGLVRTEIDHHISLSDHRMQVITLVDLAYDLQFAVLRRASEQRLSHATFRSGYNDFGHACNSALCENGRVSFTFSTSSNASWWRQSAQ